MSQRGIMLGKQFLERKACDVTAWNEHGTGNSYLVFGYPLVMLLLCKLHLVLKLLSEIDESLHSRNTIKTGS